jgi:hypothetical protein
MSKPESVTAGIPLSIAQSLAVGAMRGNATSTWNSAADMAEDFASRTQAGEFMERSGPETCRLLAGMFRMMADQLKGQS